MEKENSNLIPDILLLQDEAGNLTAELNPATLPRALLDQEKASNRKNFLVKALAHRNQVTLKVAAEIVSRQKQFLKGEKEPRPMALKDVAEATDLQESTVNHVTTGKYISTDRGVFELKYFFS